MIDKKPFRVTNEQAKEKASVCVRINQGTCRGCRYNDVKYDVCPSTYFSPELALDLLDARELIDKQEAIIKEMRAFIDNAFLLQEKQAIEAGDILEKTKEYI